MKTTNGHLATLLATACITGIAAAQTATFHFIPDALSANDMTSDGRYIVGETDLNGDSFPDGTYRYDTQTGQMMMLPDDAIEASAISDDGTIIVGCQIVPGGGDLEEVACRLNLNNLNGWVSLGWLENAGACPSRSNAYEVSADGNVVVGLSWDGCSGRGFRWDPINGMQELEGLYNGGNRASVVSADGNIIAGFAQGQFNRSPARWEADLSGALLGSDDGTIQGEVNGISDDGQILLCQWYDENSPGFSFLATTWTEADGHQTIGEGSQLPGWGGIPQDIDDNGTIVGFDFLLGNRRAWIKTAEMETMTDLKVYIQDLGAVVPAGTTLEVCQAIAADGSRIIGHGFASGAWYVDFEFECAADLSGDGTVDTIDLLDLLGEWGPCKGCPQDLNGDGTVDTIDLLDLLGAWGDCK